MIFNNKLKTDINLLSVTASNVSSRIKSGNSRPMFDESQANLFIGTIKLFKPIQKRALNEVLYLTSRYSNVFASQTRMAYETAMCRQSFNKALGVLKSLGVITVTNRGVKKTCLYSVHPFFFKPEVQKALTYHLPALANTIFYLQGLWESLSSKVRTQSYKESPATQDSLSNKLNVYLEDYGYLSLSHERVAHIRESIVTERFSSRWGEVEERWDFIHQEIVPYFKRKLGERYALTKHAAIKLMSFPVEALQSAFDHMHNLIITKAFYGDKPFFALHDMVWNYCTNMGFTIDSALYYNLLWMYDIDKNSKLIRY